MNYRIFAEYVEHKTMEQFRSAMAQDFVVKGALMPDAHLGFSLPIGAVVATDNFVVPAWPGFDLGCGVSALGLQDFAVDDVIAAKDDIVTEICARVPLGRDKHKVAQKWPEAKDFACTRIGKKYLSGALLELNTCGGGNHFLEVGSDDEGHVWVLVHSGSRMLGSRIASHYMALASGSTEPKEGHFGFAADSRDGKDYFTDALFAQAFALENRKQMVASVVAAMEKVLGVPSSTGLRGLINRNHNHVVQREIEGRPCFIHRKGATHADRGMMGVVPGTARDGSFIVRGKGNPESLYSSSHGAGRIMSRSAAKERLTKEAFREQMEGIATNSDFTNLSESPDAYKNIFEVMRQQEDLVEVVTHVRPLINIKG